MHTHTYTHVGQTYNDDEAIVMEKPPGEREQLSITA